jgi:predicted ABC-type exoprotein transport system permease subunit
VVHTWKSVVIGGVVPLVALLVVMPLLANTSASIAGIPLLFAYIFALFPLTSLCLWVAWRIDEPRYREEQVVSRAASEHGEVDG